MKLKLFAIILMFVSGSSANASFEPELIKGLSLKCPHYKFEKHEYSFGEINPKPQAINGVNFPGHQQTLFRGAREGNEQYNFSKALRGLFHEKNFVIGSPMQFALAQVLKKEWGLDHGFFPSGGLPLKMIDYISARGLLDQVQYLIECSGQNGFTQSESDAFAVDLMNKYYLSLQKNTIETRYLNMKDPDYYTSKTQDIGFGENSVDFVTTSFLDQVASMYGDKILVLKDKRSRAVDLGFWNYVHTGQFWDSWVDNGEVDVPGYIYSDEIIGYQKRRFDRTGSIGGSELQNPIEYALYRMSFKNITYVGVFDGSNELCLVQQADQKVYYCKDNWSGQISKGAVSSPIARGTSVENTAPLLGVYAICGKAAKCAVDNEIFKWYGNNKVSSRNAEYLKLAHDLSVNGSVIEFTETPESEVSLAGNPSVIKVKSATYAFDDPNFLAQAGNVTEKAASFADDKQSVEYKVRSYYLGLKNDQEPKKFEISWLCVGGKKSKLQTKVIPAPAEGVSFTMKCE